MTDVDPKNLEKMVSMIDKIMNEAFWVADLMLAARERL